MTDEHFDVIVVGAGLSGICAAYYLQRRRPGKTVAVLEARAAIGGTWDLFRYPGVRSDSDLYTFGFSFRPWRDERAIADGASILRYLRETATHFGIDRSIRFGHRVTRADWDSRAARWRVEAIAGSDGAPVRFTCAFLYACTGYYDFAEGYLPEWPDFARYRGTIVHPQHWPAGLDYSGQRIVVIGSGATAVTLIPPLAREAAHVTMLQRSPSYVVALPARDRAAGWLFRWLPERLAYAAARWQHVAIAMLFYHLARRRPALTKRLIARAARAHLPAGFDVDRHFAPRYAPWDQRVCFTPDGEFFAALHSGRASIVTGEIERFTEGGIRLQSGETLEADVVVTATGLRMRLLSGIALCIDGEPVDPATRFLYKGAMLSGVPNFAYSIGYTNASWTLKCELVARYVCRTLRYMDRHGFAVATPQVRGELREEPAIALSSGYVRRALASLPKQGSRKPWKLYQNYALDLLALRFGRLRDGAMTFTRAH